MSKKFGIVLHCLGSSLVREELSSLPLHPCSKKNAPCHPHALQHIGRELAKEQRAAGAGAVDVGVDVWVNTLL